ncbi:MAG: HlyC/CorC family transporter [Ruminococcaceae bacterium]|nr:HlyC/CorC family transporter [Oscillospiraceae bacterium]
MKYVGPLILQIVLIFLNAVFAMAEIAVISMNETKLSKLQSDGNKKAGKLLKLKSDPAKFLATIQVAITLSGFLGSAFAAENFSEIFVNLFSKFLKNADPEVLESVSVVLITLILSYFSLICGELVPKRLAMRKTESVSLGLSGTVYFVSKAFAPIVWFLTVSTNGVLRLLGIDPHADDEEVSEEDILMMAEASAEKGIIEEEERELIENIFEFDDLTVGEVTTHRTDVALLWMEETDEEWANVIRSNRFTMYPVCDGSIDNIVGVLDTKDYFRLEDQSRENVLEKAVRTPYFVPEGAKADITFRNMQKNRVSFAVVLDEYAGFSGVISIKDLLERIVGDMEDEDEPEEEQDEIQRIDERKWRIRGNASLSVLEKELEVVFPDESETLSGLVFSLYGAVPEDGSSFTVEHEGIEIAVTEVLEHQVVGAVITLPEKENEDEENDD